jgi:hypothetical protein
MRLFGNTVNAGLAKRRIASSTRFRNRRRVAKKGNPSGIAKNQNMRSKALDWLIQGVRQDKIGELMGVSQSTVQSLIKGCAIDFEDKRFYLPEEVQSILHGNFNRAGLLVTALRDEHASSQKALRDKLVVKGKLAEAEILKDPANRAGFKSRLIVVEHLLAKQIKSATGKELFEAVSKKGITNDRTNFSTILDEMRDLGILIDLYPATYMLAPHWLKR